jgi:hypothetical protein
MKVELQLAYRTRGTVMLHIGAAATALHAGVAAPSGGPNVEAHSSQNSLAQPDEQVQPPDAEQVPWSEHVSEAQKTHVGPK